MSRTLALALAAVTVATTAVPAMAQTTADTQRLQQAQDRVNRELQVYQNRTARGGYNRQGEARGVRAGERLDAELSNLRVEVERYQSLVRQSTGYAQGSTQGGYSNNGYVDNYRDDPNYDASRYYRDGNYQERVLAENDRVYRGNDGRYYCKRNDGTTGLVVGALGGGVLGNVIDGGRSRAVGTILGALGGAIAGRAVDRNRTGTDANGIRCR